MGSKEQTFKGNISLSIKERPLNIELDVPKGKVTARRMLPVFQKITDSFVRFGVEEAQKEGRTVSCKAGCGACCRQPVPISEIEAADIAAYVKSLEEPTQSQVIQRFREATEELSEGGLLETIYAADSKSDRRKAALEYFERGVACPFLVDESCSIHKIRPMACREYLVTSPAEACSNPDPETVEMVGLPATPSRIFRSIADQNKSPSKANFLLLVSALDYSAQTNRKYKKKLGEKWVAEFLSELAPGRAKKEA